jgi:hypothetical protein
MPCRTTYLGLVHQFTDLFESSFEALTYSELADRLPHLDSASIAQTEQSPDWFPRLISWNKIELLLTA